MAPPAPKVKAVAVEVHVVTVRGEDLDGGAVATDEQILDQPDLIPRREPVRPGERNVQPPRPIRDPVGGK